MPQFTPIPYRADSEVYFSRLRHLPYACWLDSGKPGDHGRYDILSALPAKRVLSKAGQTYVYQCIGTQEQLINRSTDNPFSVLQAELARLEQTANDMTPFSGGAIGYCAYTLGHSYQSSTAASGFADMAMGLYYWALVQDHHKQQAWLTHLSDCPTTTVDTITQCLAEREEPAIHPDFKLLSLDADISPQQYVDCIAKIKDYITAGDCYQVNFAHRFQGTYQGDPYHAYSALRQVLSSPYCAYLQLGDQAILSLSPERFLNVANRQVLTEPIKGTRPRYQDSTEDKNSVQRLHNSEKDRAENLMIVDLMRNDLGKHCKPGSIDVPQLFSVKSFPNVHHLVSHISGSLDQKSSSLDLFRDSFPGGSITGAPKKRAMEIIEELESSSRQVYCGSIAYINPNGDMDSNIAIRTVMCDKQQLSCWGGGGIVADSDPEEEYQESLNKINIILKTLGDL